MRHQNKNWIAYSATFLVVVSTVGFNASVNPQLASGSKVQQTDEDEIQFRKLKKGLKSKNESDRAAALEKLFSASDQKHIPLLIEMLKDSSENNVRRAIITLSKLNATEAADRIGELMQNDNASVASAAAVSALKLGYKSNLVEVQNLHERKSPIHIKSLIGLAGTLAEEEAIEFLTPFLESRSVTYRQLVIEQLAKFENETLSPMALNLVKSMSRNRYLRSRSDKEFQSRILKLVTVDELKELIKDDSLNMQELAFEMLESKGVDITKTMTFRLRSKSPEKRMHALEWLIKAGKCTDQQLVGMLEDPDESVRQKAISYVAKKKIPESLPFLRKSFEQSENEYERRYAAKALINLGQPIFTRQVRPEDNSYLFRLASEIGRGDQALIKELSKKVNQIIEHTRSLDAFPIRKSKLKDLAGVYEFSPIKNAIGRVTKRVCLNTNTAISVSDSLVAVDGNLTLQSTVSGSVIVVPGDLYAHNCTLDGCIVLVQGRFVCNGYIKDSIVVVGREDTLVVDEGYLTKSVVAAGLLSIDGYVSESLISGAVESVDDLGTATSIRNSSVYESQQIYKLLSQQAAETKK